MKEFHGHASARVDAPPQVVYDLTTNVGRLPEWNSAIEEVVDRPPTLAQGIEWTVKMHPRGGASPGLRLLDRLNLRLAYETRSGDGNPSYTKWA